MGKEECELDQIGAEDISEALERDQPLMDSLKVAKVLEQFRSPLDDVKVAKVLEQFRSPLKASQIEKVAEQLRSPLKDSHLGKLFQKSYFDVGSALAGVSVQVLVDELKGRGTDFAEGFGFDIERPPQRIDAEGHATAFAIATGEALIEKAESRTLPIKNQVLSAIPDWLLYLLIHLLINSLNSIPQWSDARESLVDINARIPHTESLSVIRKFIRTELAGKPGDIRLVAGENVNLREEPNMKSAVTIELPKNSPVVVLGKEDRTWLLVSYEHEGYWISGYVSTKFLKRVKKY